jgi:hypothetical protein
MDIRKLQKIVVSALEDIKGKDIRSDQYRQAFLDV